MESADHGSLLGFEPRGEVGGAAREGLAGEGRCMSRTVDPVGSRSIPCRSALGA